MFLQSIAMLFEKYINSLKNLLTASYVTGCMMLIVFGELCQSRMYHFSIKNLVSHRCGTYDVCQTLNFTIFWSEFLLYQFEIKKGIFQVF